MKRATFIPAIAAAALGLTTLAAVANTRGPDFSALDTDANGEITMQEMQALALYRFGQADTDGDGFLTRPEIEAASHLRPAWRANWMLSRRDANNDGKLSPEEMAGRRDPGRFFDRIDADGSGTVSQAEFDAARATGATRATGAHMKSGRGHGKGHRHGHNAGYIHQDGHGSGHRRGDGTGYRLGHDTD